MSFPLNWNHNSRQLRNLSDLEKLSSLMTDFGKRTRFIDQMKWFFPDFNLPKLIEQDLPTIKEIDMNAALKSWKIFLLDGKKKRISIRNL